VSIGLARQLGNSLEDTLRHADALVQKAKRDGRDRVVTDEVAESDAQQSEAEAP
jgi:PleD family two-component response regulator